MRISDWSSDVCSSDLPTAARFRRMTTDAISVDDFREKAQAWLAEHKGEAPRDYGAILPPDLADQGRAWQRLILAGGFAGIHWPTEYGRSEEHTSELQSLMRISYAVFCLKKKKTTTPKK